MSRIGKKPIVVPAGVKVSIADRQITIEGPRGKLQWEHRPEITVVFDAQTHAITCSRQDDERQNRALHGMTRAMIQNMITGVTEGYERRLEIIGVGYIATVQKGHLELRVGYANELRKPIPEGIQVACPDQQHIVIRGIDKQLVGQFAAETRALRKPEPYKGKGVRYYGEPVRRKQGKAMVK
jgi:large subunit ribosomal protein L6